MSVERRENDALILNEIKNFKEEFIQHKTTIEVILLGRNGQKGLCERVGDHGKEIDKLKYWQAKIMGAAVILPTRTSVTAVLVTLMLIRLTDLF